MPTRVTTRIAVRSTSPQRRPTAILCLLVLIAAALLMLWFNRGFALYAATGLSWTRTEGTVVSTRTTSIPTVEFTTADGTSESFKEDYILLCGGRSTFCFIRNFTPGERVPVVFDPRAPQHAYIHDWALTATVLSWFIVVVILAVLLLMMTALVGRPFKASVTFERGDGIEG